MGSEFSPVYVIIEVKILFPAYKSLICGRSITSHPHLDLRPGPNPILYVAILLRKKRGRGKQGDSPKEWQNRTRNSGFPVHRTAFHHTSKWLNLFLYSPQIQAFLLFFVDGPPNQLCQNNHQYGVIMYNFSSKLKCT